MSSDKALFFGISQLLDTFMAQDAAPSFVAATGELAVRHFPSVQMNEDTENICIRALVPGAELADIRLETNGGSLVLRGGIAAPRGRYHSHERPTGPFVRNIPLPAGVDADKTRATLQNGVLTVILPKADEKARIIHVSTGDAS